MSEKRSTDIQIIDIVIPAYNARNVIQISVNSILLQELPKSWQRNIIVVDDGSLDGTAQYCRELFQEQIKILIHEHNRGRSSSRNTGWRSGSGKYVIFMDADCRWLSSDALTNHLKLLESGIDVSIGPIISDDQSFWGAYQNKLQLSREKNFYAGNHAAFTSANFAIRRSALEASGGFDKGYHHYGFEDRDFQLRLISLGAKISFCPDALIFHNPDSSFRDICRKMMESGENSSARFQSAHPEYYSRSAYGKLDCRLHRFPLTALAMIFGPWIPGLALLGDKMINLSVVPFHMKKACVKIMSGLAYMTGTYRGMKR